MNALAGHVVVANLSREPVDPYAGIEAYREEIDIGRLRHDLGVSRKVLHQSVIVARRRGALCASFRYCRRCLGRGYYSLVHQFERVSQCPMHGQPLETACRWCGCQGRTVCKRDCWRHHIVARNAERSMARSGQDCRSGAEYR